MSFLIKTNEYYSKWIGSDGILKEKFKGAKFIYSSERNKVQNGYAKQFDLLIFYQPNRIIFSYGDKSLDQIDKVKQRIKTFVSIDYLKQVLTEEFGDYFNHNIKYVFEKASLGTGISRPLEKSEYPKYYDFFTRNNPKCKNTEWLIEYFDKMVNEHLCCGAFIGDILVSCSDAPSMAYMQNDVQEIGINTLNEYKGKGYATDACITCANEIVRNGKCPQWSTTVDNLASQKLAEKVGFTKLADVISISV